LTPEYKSQDGSGTAVYHRFEDRSIILSRNHTYRGLYPQSHLCILGSSFLTPDPLVETLEYIYSRYLSKQRIRAQGPGSYYQGSYPGA